MPTDAPDLLLHGRHVGSVFELLGTSENDITYSLGWALAKSGQLRDALMGELFPGARGIDVTTVGMQDHKRNEGITDVQLLGPDLHVIVEAKRGWTLPSTQQLQRYLPRLDRTLPHVALVTMSECTSEYAGLQPSYDVDGVPVRHLSWRDVQRLAGGGGKRGRHGERVMLEQFRTYLERIVKIQNQESNMVYVVSVGGDTPAWSSLSWRQMVNDRRRYFHPIGIKGWPKEPPNYIAFRYDNQLQSIHHIDSWKIITDVHPEMPELTPGPWKEPHFLYTLGPPIVPARTVKTGRIYPTGRVWAMLDLLLSCDTISEARDETDKRLKAP